MGIKGLTTFVRNKSEFCMERFELHDTDIVIDGDAVLCQLYLRHTFHKNACFGGDYDKFGNTIYKFFLMLSECKVTPYVILDGGYESRKMDTILERFKSRLEKVTVLNPRTQNKNTSTPLFIRETFEDIAVKLNIKMDNPIDPEDIDKFEDQLDSTYNTYEKLTTSFPAPFIENFRKSLYPTRFLDILTQNKYYNFKPQVELDCLGHSHTPSIEIMSAVQKVLTSSQENLVCLVRIGQNVGEQVLPVCRHDLPSFRELQKMDKDARKQIILRVINIDNSFITNTLTSFPESWHLFILTLKYMINKSIISWPLVYTLIICKIVISHLDPKIGFHRTVQTFNRQYLYRIREMWGQKRTLPSTYWNVKDFLNAITFEDALLVMSQVMPYFEMNNQLLRDYRSFDRALMHTTSQFQSVLLHVKCLNQLFNMPFADFLISDCFNGTFVYNLTENLTRRPDVDNFLNYCFRKSPLIMHIFELIVSSVKGESRIPLGEKRRRIDVCQSSHMNVVYN
ncbi:uncharacterized protein isoform X3 [Leptinotarsa decemlineata]|uniref:uncharacterized protein isoform X3 n=1 Tax=Leptinotarsa decemlineata TaxID=7539 RepID=UPI003D3051DD